MLTDPTTAKIESVRLPRIGEVVYQGLPLAAVTVADKPQQFIPAPLSGVVVAVNEALKQDPSLLLSDPCGKGWIACISATRVEDEAANCVSRRVTLYNPDAATAHMPRPASCAASAATCIVAADWAQLSCGPRRSGRPPVVILDDSAIGDEGPVTVGLINGACPGAKVIVVAAADANREAAYRLRRIFYYAVEPFADNEMAEILDAAFHRPSPAPPRRSPPRDRPAAQQHFHHQPQRHAGPPADRPGAVAAGRGSGPADSSEARRQALPHGEFARRGRHHAHEPREHRPALRSRDRAHDRRPGPAAGQSAPRHQGRIRFALRQRGDKVVALVVQPAGGEGGILNFDPETNDALATHLVREMASC